MSLSKPAQVQLWFTIQEIADASFAGILVGMPTSAGGAHKQALRENWQRYSALARPRSGREGGGGFEYHIDLFPNYVRSNYLRQFMQFAPEDMRDVILMGGIDGLTERARQERDARLIILRTADRFHKNSGLSVIGSDGVFVAFYNEALASYEAFKREIISKTKDALKAEKYLTELIDSSAKEATEDDPSKKQDGNSIPYWILAVVKQLSPRTLRRWRLQVKREDVSRLAHDPSRAQGETALLTVANDGAVRIFILALIARQPALTAAHVRQQCRFKFGDEIADQQGELRAMPPLRTFQRFLKVLRVENKVLLTRFTDPDRYKSHFRPSGSGAFSYITEPNELWQIDASPVDAMCVDGRHSIYICLDIATRRIAITVSRTPRASAVGAMVRKAILQFGVAQKILTDNGSDFTAKETARLFDALDIDVEATDAYSPEQKGHVERAIKTFQHDLPPQLPGYVGHNPGERKSIENRKSFARRLGQSDAEAFGTSLTGAELQAYVDQWVELHYHPKPHSGLDGLSPNEAAAETSTTIRTVDANALDILLMPLASRNGRRRVTKKGVSIGKFHYMIGSVLAGTEVVCRMHTEDAGQVYVYSEDGGTFLGIATCAKLSGLHPSTVARAEREIHKEILDEAARPIKQQIKQLVTGPNLADRSLEVSRRDAEARAAEAANVIRLPRREEEHSTPQIAAAIEAFEQPSKPVPSARLSPNVLAAHQQIIADLNGERAESNVMPLRVQETVAQRFWRMIEIERRRDEGGEISADEAYELGSYQQSSEYKSRKTILEDFGETASALQG